MDPRSAAGLEEATHSQAPPEADPELEETAWVKGDRCETRLGGPSGSAAGLEEATHSQAPPEADPKLEEAAAGLEEVGFAPSGSVAGLEEATHLQAPPEADLE